MNRLYWYLVISTGQVVYAAYATSAAERERRIYHFSFMEAAAFRLQARNRLFYKIMKEVKRSKAQKFPGKLIRVGKVEFESQFEITRKWIQRVEDCIG